VQPTEEKKEEEDVSVQNGWQLHRSADAADRKKCTLVQFGGELAMTYISKYSNRQSVGRPNKLSGTRLLQHKVAN